MARGDVSVPSDLREVEVGRGEMDKFRVNSARKFPEKHFEGLVGPPPAVPRNFKNKRTAAPAKTMDIPSILRPTLSPSCSLSTYPCGALNICLCVHA